MSIYSNLSLSVRHYSESVRDPYFLPCLPPVLVYPHVRSICTYVRSYSSQQNLASFFVCFSSFNYCRGRIFLFFVVFFACPLPGSSCDLWLDVDDRYIYLYRRSALANTTFICHGEGEMKLSGRRRRRRRPRRQRCWLKEKTRKESILSFLLLLFLLALVMSSNCSHGRSTCLLYTSPSPRDS